MRRDPLVNDDRPAVPVGEEFVPRGLEPVYLVSL